jgi:CDP-paratose 2-epimerase
VRPNQRSERRILVTGGAGFVGSNLCLALAERHPAWQLVAFDNLRRRGSELNLPRLREQGVEFVHGDIRDLNDVLEVGRVDAVVECSAEPSVMAGVDGDTAYPVQTNLVGAYNALELCRRTGAQFVFLSTSRVYPVAALSALEFAEDETRFVLSSEQPVPGASEHGVSEDFPLSGARTLYGATKLSAELLAAEYAESFGIPVTIDRCGVIAGPWQMGKVDQGVFTYWVLAHYFKRPLSYIGFGGGGKQVRDLLHAQDLVDLIEDQLDQPERWRDTTLNVGGGVEGSLSLVETTQLCSDITGNDLAISHVEETRAGDVPVYISDCRRLFEHSDWRPRRTPADVIEAIFEWVRANERTVKEALQ